MNEKEKIRKSWETYTKDIHHFLTKDLKRNTNTKHKSKKEKLFAKVYKYLHEFCDLSTFHGCRQLAARGRHWTEYTLWSAVMLAAMGMTLYISRFSWNRHHHFPTVIVMEKNNHDWSIAFPAATICPDDKLNITKLEELAIRYKVKNQTAFVEFFQSLAQSTLATFSYLPDYDEISPKDYYKIIIEATLVFPNIISSTLTEDSERLDPAFTEFGVCYSYNSKTAWYFTPPELANGTDVDRSAEFFQITIHDDDSFASVFVSTEYNVTISGPYELPVEGTAFTPSNKVISKEIDVACLAIISTKEVRELNLEQRKCQIRGDSSLAVSKIYSYNLCRMECRLNLGFKLCGCISYVYTFQGSGYIEKMPICDVKGMKCLGKHGKRLSDLRDPVTKIKDECLCYSLCSDFNFRVLATQDYDWGAKRVKWQVAGFPRARYKRTILFSFADMMVAIGATAGLFMGCSMLSFVELAYFFTLRLAVILYNNHKPSSLKTEANFRKTKKLPFSEFSN